MRATAGDVTCPSPAHLGASSRTRTRGQLAIAVLDVFAKSTRKTPDDVIRNCKRRLADFKTRDKP